MDDVEELEAAARAVVGHPLVLDVPARVDREGELLQGQGVLLLPAVLQPLHVKHFFPRPILTPDAKRCVKESQADDISFYIFKTSE